MGRPVDRIDGVVLVTDYGALDRALAQKARIEAKKVEMAEKSLYNLKKHLRGLFQCLILGHNSSYMSHFFDG